MANQMLSDSKIPGYGAYPTWFRARCQEASQPGPGGYASAGHAFISAVHSFDPYDVEPDEWDARVLALADLVDAQDDAGILAWMARHVPRCLALIPPRRRGQFLKGVARAVAEGEVDIRSW